ncbi:MAG: hypothetical protein HY291_20480 [Planctomycetes bacterium]|nr:hypothetical protein [Planctomycetota bacterium]
MSSTRTDETLRIGWAQAEITPEKPVLVCGQFHARVSEGVEDPLTATAWALEAGDTRVVFVSCDIVCISDEFRDAVRTRVKDAKLGLDPKHVILNATHTHAGPEVRPSERGPTGSAQAEGVDLPVMDSLAYVAFAAERVAGAVARAWKERAPGRVAFGLGQAVVGRNRRWVDTSGKATMYGNLATPMFSHIEGFEDHSVNVMAAYDRAGKLTGLVVNVPCPSQVSEHQYLLSADYWCETRQELRARFGEHLFIFPQCSAAGDLSPHAIFEKAAVRRMLELQGRSARREIAKRIAAAVEDVLPAIAPTATGDVALEHRVEDLALPLSNLTAGDVRAAQAEAEKHMAAYKQEMQKLENDPDASRKPRWYVDASMHYRRAGWFKSVAARFERQQAGERWPAELHVVRLGEAVFATNPFEYYLDFGTFIKANSPAVQTFLIQLAGPGTYVPSSRSVAGGGYGSIPASNPVGPEGGRLVADRTLELIREMTPA